MSLSPADLTELKQEFERTVKQLDLQIEQLETIYLEETKETVSSFSLRVTSSRDLTTTVRLR